MKLVVSHRTLPMRGEARNGDAVFLRQFEDGSLFVCVIDALGHGPHAADVADRALAHLEGVALSFDAVVAITRLHEALRGTRGAAATVCTLKEGALSASGVGNVTLRSIGTNVPFVLTPGILGNRVHALRSASARLVLGDRIVIHTDGIGSVFPLDPLRGLATNDACERLFEVQRKATDDATLLVLDVCADDG